MGEVIQMTLKPTEAPGWVCGCGGTTWTLFANGECLCDQCEHINTVIKVKRADAVDPEVSKLKELIRRAMEWEPVFPLEGSLIDEMGAAIGWSPNPTSENKP